MNNIKIFLKLKTPDVKHTCITFYFNQCYNVFTLRLKSLYAFYMQIKKIKNLEKCIYIRYIFNVILLY